MGSGPSAIIGCAGFESPARFTGSMFSGGPVARRDFDRVSSAVFLLGISP
jgi:hypothetical protein